MNQPTLPIIAVDGPAASGKGTLARRLATHFDFAYLDTGKLYRAVGLKVVRTGGDPEDEEAAEAAARALDTTELDDPALSGDDAASAASKWPRSTACARRFWSFSAASPPCRRKKKRAPYWTAGISEP